MFEYKSGWWETKDHKLMKIEDMETTHIKNTIKYLEKHTDFYDQAGGIAGDIDTYYYEDNSYLVEEKIQELEYELNKRKGIHNYEN